MIASAPSPQRSKAQAELANPEKSLTATIVSPFPREGNRTFRYASLSSGLELVRKCLGQHEIATVQTTAIDKEANLICLTTTLVHASGEWVSSEWPVCSTSETAAPHRLGAALTYARRYALFTLVGIAGDDDLDAPDLVPATTIGSQADENTGEQRPLGVEPAISSQSPRVAKTRRRADKQTTLETKASAEMRNRLVAELGPISGSEGLASWAHNVLPIKNQLTKADADAVEAAFALKIDEAPSSIHLSEEPGSAHANGDHDQSRPNQARRDFVVSIPKPLRERDRNHLRHVASQPCLLCGRTPSDPHHVKFAELSAMGRKVSDKFAVPVCRLHHRELHRRGNERLAMGLPRKP